MAVGLGFRLQGSGLDGLGFRCFAYPQPLLGFMILGFKLGLLACSAAADYDDDDDVL